MTIWWSLVLAVVGGLVAGPFHRTVGLAPLLAGVVCASCFLRRRDMLIVGLGTFAIREAFTGVSAFTPVRLAGLLAVLGIVWALRVRPKFSSLLPGLALSAVAYHLTLMVGDWATQMCSKQPHTWAGLMATIAGSWPYAQRSLATDLGYAGVFLLAYTAVGYWVRVRWPAALPQPQPQPSR